MKSIITDALVIIAAAIGIIFLLKKGGDAGASKVAHASAPALREVVDAAPVRPQMIEGRLDNFKEEIPLKPIRSWATGIKYGFMLAVSANPKLNQPSVRVVLAEETAAPVVLEIQYTIDENILRMIEANPAVKDKFDGVAVEVSTEGAGSNSSALLKLDPKWLADHHTWLSHNLTLPTATREVDFWIAGTPPSYNVFFDSCAIYLPQLRVTLSKRPATPSAKPRPTPAGF